MAQPYNGQHSYDKAVVTGWNSTAIGIYYCGYLNQTGQLVPCYIGKGTGQDGIRGRLLDHLNQDHWPDVTHFGFILCNNAQEAEGLERTEIGRHRPKYNTQLV